MKHQKKSGLQESKYKAGHQKVFEVTAAVSSSCWFAVQRTRSWERLNTSGSPWTLYSSMDTPLSTVREELKGTAEKSQAEALSLCVSLSLRHTSLYTLTRPLSILRAYREKPAELLPHLFTEYTSLTSVLLLFFSVKHVTTYLIQVIISYIDLHWLNIWVHKKTKQQQKTNASVLFHFNQPQMANTHTHTLVCASGFETTKQPCACFFSRVSVCVCIHARTSSGQSSQCCCPPHPPTHPLCRSLSLFLSLAINWSGQL